VQAAQADRQATDRPWAIPTSPAPAHRVRELEVAMPPNLAAPTLQSHSVEAGVTQGAGSCKTGEYRLGSAFGMLKPETVQWLQRALQQGGFSPMRRWGLGALSGAATWRRLRFNS